MTIKYEIFGDTDTINLESQLSGFTEKMGIRRQDIIKITHTMTPYTEYDDEGEPFPTTYESIMLVYEVMDDGNKSSETIGEKLKHLKG